MSHELVLFSSGDLTLSVPVTPDRETVWLTQEQMSELFDTARSSIAYHIGKIFKEEELDKSTSVEIFDRSTKTASRPPMYYNLDVIISVGYRVKSMRGIEFRKWANNGIQTPRSDSIIISKTFRFVSDIHSSPEYVSNRWFRRNQHL